MGWTEEKGIRKTSAVHAVEGGKPRRPFFRNRQTTHAVDLIARATGIVCAHLKASGEDNAVHGIFFAIKNDAGFSDLIQTTTIGIHQGNVGPVVCRQVLIVKTRSLTELTIVGLQ